MSDNRTTTIEKNGISIESGYGCQMMRVEYSMTVVEEDGIKNVYGVKCEVRGLETADIYLNPFDVTYHNGINSDGDPVTNCETLGIDGVKELFECEFVYND